MRFFSEKSDKLGFTLTTLTDEITGAVTSNLQNALGEIAQGIVAKFIPGAGAIRSLYQGFTWVLENYDQAAGLVDQFFNAILAPTWESIRNGVQSTLNNSVPVLMSFAAHQLGMTKLPNEIKAAATAIPEKFYGLLRKAVGTAVSALPKSGNGDTTYKGIQNIFTEFDHDGMKYRLWAADDKTAKVRVARLEPNGTWKMIRELTVADFNMKPNHLSALIDATKEVVRLSAVPKQTPKPPANQPNLGQGTPGNSQQLANMRQAQTALATAQGQVVADIQAHACAILNAGCFAAGTKLWTPEGYRKVEDINEGEYVYARNEADPFGEITARLVEKKFQRTGQILHVHVNSEVIRTTPEHPFYVRKASRVASAPGEWLAVGALQPGDDLRTDSGWVKVEEIFDTGEYETVYNLRVAEDHTYFVGEEEWGFAVWAHNLYDFISALKVVDVVQNLLGTGVSLSSSMRDQIVKDVRKQGNYGAVGDVNALAARIKTALTAAGASTASVSTVIDGYFNLQTIQDDKKKQTHAIDNTDTRQIVTGGQKYENWNEYIRLKFSDHDSTGRTRAEYDQWLTNNGRAAEIPLTHGHHIVFKKGIGAAGHAASQEAKDMLLYFDINPYWSQANLAYAPNPNLNGHKDAVMVKIKDLLKAEFTGWKSMSLANAQTAVKAFLADIADKWIKRDPVLGFPSP